MNQVARTVLLLVFVSVFSFLMSGSPAFADTMKLLDAVPLSYQSLGPAGDPITAIAFAGTSRVLQCDTLPVQATLSSTADGTGPVVVDNFLTVNGVDVCVGGYYGCGNQNNCNVSCFQGFFWGSPVGSPASTSYYGVPALDISAQLLPGRNNVTFEVLDWGAPYASSEIWLITNCTMEQDDAVCHKPGTPAEKTLHLPQAAVPGHLGHGDYPGACK
jgi:hypothetical protein